MKLLFNYKLEEMYKPYKLSSYEVEMGFKFKMFWFTSLQL